MKIPSSECEKPTNQITTKDQAHLMLENLFVDGGWSLSDYISDLERIIYLSKQSKEFNKKDQERLEVMEEILNCISIIYPNEQI